jgi:hypothetical protein
MARFQVLRPFLEGQVELTAIAREHSLSLRTLRWVQRYDTEGLAGLVRQRRTDRGRPRRLSPVLYQCVEGLALQKPPLSIAVIHRQICALAQQHQLLPGDLPGVGWCGRAPARHHPREETRDPTSLLIIDEADRLKTASLEQVRDIFDQGELGVVLIGMPGLEKRLSRYPQLYSRVGFVHAFRRLSVVEVRQLLESQWLPSGVALPEAGLSDEETRAAIIRTTGGNFRLLQRLLTQMARLVEINALSQVMREVVEAAREALVIGVN